MIDRMQEQKDEIRRKLGADHKLVKAVDSSLEKAKAFRDWFYQKFDLNNRFDLDTYMICRHEQFRLRNENKDRSKVQAVLKHALESNLPRFLGLKVKNYYVSATHRPRPSGEMTLTLDTGLSKVSQTSPVKFDRPFHWQVELAPEMPMKFELSGFTEEDIGCDFVNLLAANNMTTWIGPLALDFEVRLWPDKDLEDTYAQAAR